MKLVKVFCILAIFVVGVAQAAVDATIEVSSRNPSELLSLLSKIHLHADRMGKVGSIETECPVNTPSFRAYRDMGYVVIGIGLGEHRVSRSQSQRWATKLGTLGLSHGPDYLIHTKIKFTLENAVLGERVHIEVLCKNISPKVLHEGYDPPPGV